LVFGAVTLPASVLYVDDGVDVFKYASNGTPSVFSNQPGTTVIGMAFNSSGTLYAAARDSNAVYSYSLAGVRTTFATVTSPFGLAVDSFGDVFVGANFGASIVKYTPGGSSSVFATGTSVGAMTFDANGNLFESDNNTIYEYAPNGTRTTFATGLPTLILGLAFDNAGNLYASDWSGEINKFTPGGQRSIFATFSTSMLPSGLAYDSDTGTLYMAEVANGTSQPGQQKIFAFSPSGQMSVFATGLLTPFGIAEFGSVAGTPEPGTLALMAGTLGAIALRLRRRR
jgi:hypothetical protein